MEEYGGRSDRGMLVFWAICLGATAVAVGLSRLLGIAVF